jgi:hypothetical protein
VCSHCEDIETAVRLVALEHQHIQGALYLARQEPPMSDGRFHEIHHPPE